MKLVSCVLISISLCADNVFSCIQEKSEMKVFVERSGLKVGFECEVYSIEIDPSNFSGDFSLKYEYRKSGNVLISVDMNLKDESNKAYSFLCLSESEVSSSFINISVSSVRSAGVLACVENYDFYFPDLLSRDDP